MAFRLPPPPPVAAPAAPVDAAEGTSPASATRPKLAPPPPKPRPPPPSRAPPPLPGAAPAPAPPVTPTGAAKPHVPPRPTSASVAHPPDSHHPHGHHGTAHAHHHGHHGHGHGRGHTKTPSVGGHTSIAPPLPVPAAPANGIAGDDGAAAAPAPAPPARLHPALAAASLLSGTSSGAGGSLGRNTVPPKRSAAPSLAKPPGAPRDPTGSSGSSTLKKGDLASPFDPAVFVAPGAAGAAGAARPPPPIPNKPNIARPLTPPGRAREEMEKIRPEIKAAMEAKNWDALKELVRRGDALHVADDVLSQAHKQLDDKSAGEAKAELSTVTFYLKQGCDMKSRDALKLALGKADGLLKSAGSGGGGGGQHPFGADFSALVERSRKLLALLEKENADTLKHFVKQGMLLRSREMLKETMDKIVPQQQHLQQQTLAAGGSAAEAAAAAADILGDRDLLVSAQEMLKSLDAQHLIKFYLTSATKAKDLEALEGALEKARALLMGQDIKEVADATKLLAELKAKLKKKSGKAGTSGFSALFGGGAKDGKEQPKLFGGSLSEAVKKSNGEIPKICSACIEYLEAKALAEPGLFRVPGNNDNIYVLEKQFSDDLPDIKLDEVHDVAGLLKLYLRRLPAPLIPFAAYDEFVKAGQQFGPKDARRHQRFRELCDAQLPVEERALLRRLSHFLKAVSAHSDVNKMTTDNIAIVFAPNLLRPKQETPQSMMQEMPITISVISTFIERADDIFPDAGAAGAAGAAS